MWVTTKEVGLGTGLGLSMVFEFARQSGGGVTVSTHPSKGSPIQGISAGRLLNK